MVFSVFQVVKVNNSRFETSQVMVKFPRLDRGGFMWGLDVPQLVIFTSALLSLVIVFMTSGFQAAAVWSIVAVPVIIFGTVSWSDRSLVSRTRVFFEHLFRRVAGKTEWKISEKPVETGTLPLPGKPGARVSVLGTKWAKGAVIYDAQAQTASVALRCESVGWPLSDDRDKRASAFADICRSLVRRPHIERVAIQARTIPATRSGAFDWFKDVSELRGVDDPWGQQVTELVLDGDQFVGGEGNPVGPESRVVPVQRDTIVVLTMSLRLAAKAIKAAGGGTAGAAQVLAGEVRQFSEDLKGCGVHQVEWLSPAQVGDAVRVALDPDSADKIQQMSVNRTDDNDIAHAAAMFIDDDDPNRLVTSGGLHQTFWINQWPQTEVTSGFFETLICEGDYPHSVTLVFRVETIEKALKNIQDRKYSLESKRSMNEKLGRKSSILDEFAAEELKQREFEIASGHVDVKVTGYVRVSATDEDSLELNTQSMLRDAKQLDLQLLKRQQWEAFCASSLPLGWGL